MGLLLRGRGGEDEKGKGRGMMEGKRRGGVEKWRIRERGGGRRGGREKGRGGACPTNQKIVPALLAAQCAE